MKLNPDIIREIMLYVEETHNGYMDRITIPMRPDDFKELNILRFQSYDTSEVIYHIKQCQNFNLLDIKLSMAVFFINDITPLGHQFLANIRENTNWNKTKEIAKKVGSTSLDVLVQVASSVISESVNKLISK